MVSPGGAGRCHPPVVPLHQDDGKHGQDEGHADGSGYLLGSLDIHTDMTAVVPSCYSHLEPGLLLHKHNLQTLVLEGHSQKKSQ